MTAQNKKNPRSGANNTLFPDLTQIRKQAEQKTKDLPLPDLDTMTHEEIRQMVREMQVKQIEARLENKQLRNGLEHTNDILTGISDGVWSLTWPDLEIVYLNPATEEIYGRPLADFYENPDLWQEVTYPEDREITKSAFEQLRKTGRARRECRIVRSDGSIAWILDRSKLIFDENNNPVRVDGICRDITERKQAEQKTEIRLKLISYASGHSLSELMTKALDEVEQIVNSAISFLHFVQPDQKTLTLQQWSMATSERFCKASGRGFHYSIDKAGIWADGVRLRKGLIHNDYESMTNKKGLPEGHAEVIREMVVPVMRKGVIVAIMGVGNKPVDYTPEDLDTLTFLADVTWEVIAVKQTEDALIASEERLRGITDSTRDAVIMMDPQGAISFWNPAAERILGYRAEEVLGQDLHELLAPNRYHERFRAAFSVFRETGRGHAIGKTIELSALHKDGREVMVELTLSAVLLQGKWHAAGILRDITQRKKISAALRKAWRKAEDANRQLSMELLSLSELQQSLLPSEPYISHNLSVQGIFQPSGLATGDYFDYLPLDGGGLRCIIADVSGHGARASFIMSMVRTFFHFNTNQQVPLSAMIEALNRQLMQTVGRQGDFVTLLVMDIHPEKGCIQYINAGHCPGFLRKGKSFTEIEATGPILGVVDTDYPHQDLKCHDKWEFLMYTDGLYECQVQNRGIFGYDSFKNLCASLLNSGGFTVDQLPLHVARAAPGIVGFDDDLTALHIVGIFEKIRTNHSC